MLPRGDVNKAAKERSKNKNIQSSKFKRVKPNLAEEAMKMGTN